MTNNIPPIHHIRNTSKLDKAAKFTVGAVGVALAIVLLCNGYGLSAILVLLGTLALVALMHKLGKSKSSEGNTDKLETDTPRMANPQAEACNSSAASMTPFDEVVQKFRQHLATPTVPPEITVAHDWKADAHTGDLVPGITWVDHHKETISTLQKRLILQNMQPYVGSNLQALANVPLTILCDDLQPKTQNIEDNNNADLPEIDLDNFDLRSLDGEPDPAAVAPSNQLNYQQFKLEKTGKAQWKLTFELLSSMPLTLDNQSKVALSYAKIAINFTQDARDDLPTALKKGLEANNQQQVMHKLQLVDEANFQSKQDTDLARHITEFAKA